jgi:hypothetical protein
MYDATSSNHTVTKRGSARTSSSNAAMNQKNSNVWKSI